MIPLKYNLLIITLFLFGAELVMADTVTVHEDKFTSIPAGSGDQFYGRLMSWSVWDKSPEQAALQIPFNHVAVAKEEVITTSLSYSDFEQLDLPGFEADEAFVYYDERELEMPDKYKTPGGAVFHSKVQIDLPDAFDFDSLTLGDFDKIISRADAPHLHRKVNKDWVSSFLPNYHAGHEMIDEKGEEAYYSFVVVNTGNEYYSCRTLNTSLILEAIASDLSMSFSYRQYLVNRVVTLEPDQISVDILDAGAKKVFKQQIVFSSNLIKSGESHMGFYEESETGKKKLIITNSVVLSDKVLNFFTDIFINGLNSNRPNPVKVANQEVLLNQSNTDIRASHSGRCGQGLGLGVASYVYNLAKKVVEGVNE